MNNLFRLEVDTGFGGYDFTDIYIELLETDEILLRHIMENI